MALWQKEGKIQIGEKLGKKMSQDNTKHSI